MREATDSGTRLYLMHGNRDFLIGKQFCRETGAELLNDPSLVTLEGQRILLMHGDSLCTQDLAYMKLRRWLRHPLTLFILRHLPLSTRFKLARKLRSESKAQTRMKAAEIIDVTPELIPQVLAQYGVTTLIHGHTHRPATHDLRVNGQPARRIVLGDWDACGWALQIDQNGFQQAPFALD